MIVWFHAGAIASCLSIPPILIDSYVKRDSDHNIPYEMIDQVVEERNQSMYMEVRVVCCLASSWATNWESRRIWQVPPIVVDLGSSSFWQFYPFRKVPRNFKMRCTDGCVVCVGSLRIHVGNMRCTEMQHTHARIESVPSSPKLAMGVGGLF